MGQPRKQRSKYSGPRHPWQRTRLDEEKIIRRTYGTKNKKEIWKMNAVIDKITEQAKRISSLPTEQAEAGKNAVLQKTKKLGLIKEGQGFDDLLGLTLKDVMERRLQTLVHKKGFASTIKQARQLITHEHILVAGRKITSPSYIVPAAEEDKINFSHDSPFTRPEHPERVKYEEKKKKTQPKEVAEELEKKAKEIEAAEIVEPEELEIIEEKE